MYCKRKKKELNELIVTYKDHVKINTLVVKLAVELGLFFVHLQFHLCHYRHKDELLTKVIVAVAWCRETRSAF